MSPLAPGNLLSMYSRGVVFQGGSQQVAREGKARSKLRKLFEGSTRESALARLSKN